MCIYNKKMTYFVTGGLALFHLLVAGLCVFWSYTFLIASYDPSVFPLLAMFIGMTVLLDVIALRNQAFSRFFVRFRTDANGIHCAGLGWKKWSILWANIRVFGVLGYTPDTGMGIIFLSTDRNEKYSREKCVSISRQRIVFEADERIWKELSLYMPNDIKLKLRKSIDEKRDCYYRR